MFITVKVNYVFISKDMFYPQRQPMAEADTKFIQSLSTTKDDAITWMVQKFENIHFITLY